MDVDCSGEHDEGADDGDDGADYGDQHRRAFCEAETGGDGIGDEGVGCEHGGEEEGCEPPCVEDVD